MGNNPVLYMDFLGDTTIPVSDVQNLDGFLAGEENHIGLNGVTVTASRGYNSFYDPLYTGASVGPLGVKWVSTGMSGGGFTTKGQSYFNLNNFDPTTTIKANYNFFTTPGVKMDVFSTETTYYGTSPVELIMNPITKKQISTSYHLRTGIYDRSGWLF